MAHQKKHTHVHVDTAATIKHIILVLFLLGGAGVAIWAFLSGKIKPSIPSPKDSNPNGNSNTGGELGGLEANQTGIPEGDIFTEGTRKFICTASGFQISGYTNSSILSNKTGKMTIPFPRYIAGPPVTSGPLIDDYIVAVAAVKGKDGCGFDSQSINDRIQTLKDNKVDLSILN